jgi:hypothetical protein
MIFRYLYEERGLNCVAKQEDGSYTFFLFVWEVSCDFCSYRNEKTSMSNKMRDLHSRYTVIERHLENRAS